ncbi:NADPH dehydrogenase [Lasiosphaeria miniovina]|uniref:NADPH dehydrogenase n=1 Tax=Lasiosphaeria miniovina TaxID=1954250 RepID=A0AA40B4H7_9PEZI|nr:NADPH dehydrogenase [Lasiosphaeria miniovina]KAK0727516.1 NADPH dehydrogenase [Lasiosphaeria miniovina]
MESAKPITLKCGLTLPNRTVKAAMVENLARAPHFLPNEQLLSLYRLWADGGWGMIMTGNVQVDTMHSGGPGDVGVDAGLSDAELVAAFGAWAQSCGTSAASVVQLSHPGRQSPAGAGKRGLFAKTVAPSAVPLRLGTGIVARVGGAIVFGTPRAMTLDDIAAVVAQFARGARICAEAGFAGVEIHGAHGYLLAQFLSESANRRTDAYGGSPEARAKFVVDIVRAVREATAFRKGFCVGIKLNSVDHQSAAALSDCVKQLRLIEQAGVDFIEISGGTYEDPQMILGRQPTEKKSARTVAREAFFLEFARAIRSEFPDTPLMVTGGFRTRTGVEAAVASGDCELVGIARPAVMNPALPSNTLFNPEVSDADATLFSKKIEPPWLAKKLGIMGIGAGFETIWYNGEMKRLVTAKK